MQLPNDIIKKIVLLNQDFIQIIKDQQKNPSSFDVNVDCLKRMEVLSRAFMHVMKPYFESQHNVAEKLNHTKWNIFTKKAVTSEFNKFKDLIDQAYSLLFDDELKELQNDAFKDKPITGLKANFNDKKTTTYKGDRLFQEESSETHTVIYEISFLDGTNLSWDPLKGQNELFTAKALFLTKVPQPIVVAKKPEQDFEEMDDYASSWCSIS